MTEGLLSRLRLANVLFGLAVVSTSVQAGSFSAVNITFPMFMDEVTQKRVTYYEGDSLLVTWSTIATIRYLDLYCSRSDELSWGGHPYGSGVMDFLSYASGDIGNAKNMNVTAKPNDPTDPSSSGSMTVQNFQLMNLPSYNSREIVECGFVAVGFCGDDYCTGFGYPFKFFNYHRYNPVTTTFGPEGPIEILDKPYESATLSTQTTTATGTSATAASSTSPPATTSTGPATGIETGTAESSDAKKNGGGLSNGVIAGIGAGGATLVIIIAVLSFLLFRRHRKSQSTGAAAVASNPSTDKNASEKGGGEGGVGEQEKGSMTFFKAELEDNPKTYGNELDGTCIEAEKKEKPQVSELGAAEARNEIDGGKCQERFELA